MVQEKITLEYLKELDKRLEFIPMTMDFMFKSVMQRNANILEKFLVDLMNLKINKNDYLVFLDEELIKGNIKEKGRVVDIKVKFGNKYLIQIEVNRKKYQAVKLRNDLYLERIDTLRVEVNNNYIKDFDTEYLYQLNLNASSEEDKQIGLSSLVEYDRINKVITSDRIEKYSANLEYYYNLLYNKDEEMSFSGIFMAGLMSKSYTELYKIMSKILSEKELNKLIKDVIYMTNEELLYNIHYWEKEKMDALVEHAEKEEARKAKEAARKEGLEEGIKTGIEEGRRTGIEEGREEGFKEGHAEGRAEGRAEGIENSKLEMIQNMLIKKIDYKTISDVSGKTIEEIKEIEKHVLEELK